MFPTIITTADGSHSLYIKELNEHYHSIHGAIQESTHVFINAGLKQFTSTLVKRELNILEIGLGTGLNALLTLIEADKSIINIGYTAIEAYPLSKDLIQQLNYAELLRTHDVQPAFNAIHICEWEREEVISNLFTICKIKNTLQNTVLENKYHLVYFDAFGPSVQPEMWTKEVFSKLYDSIQPNGILVTYCAKGEVKRTLKKIGFTVESLQGPPGKREMIRAIKS